MEPSPAVARAARAGFEVVIGLETHAQLKTRAKLFSSAPNQFGAEPNTQTTEVDIGMPGVLPVINARAVELALRMAIAVGCKIRPFSRFERKHYFYPDLPKGYQISQFEEPYAEGGVVPIELAGEMAGVPLTRIHMEEDAGKSIHDDAITGRGVSHVDLNRAGVPLIEIVTEPAIRSPEEAGAYLRSLRQILRYLDVSDADMEKGNFRCDANVSLRKIGDAKLGVRVELKNMNSFRNVEKALAYEIERQTDVLAAGEAVEQETRHWDDRTDTSRPSRGKEDAEDYRYFPDPDLVPLQIGEERIEAVRASLPELPHEKRARYRDELELPADTAQVLADDRDVAAFFEATVQQMGNPRLVANWTMRSLLEVLKEGGAVLADLPITPTSFAALLGLVDTAKLTPANARTVFAEMVREGGDPAEIMRARGLEAVSDTGELEAQVQRVLDANPTQVEQVRAGEEKVLNYLLGQVMKETRGKAAPAVVREILSRLLG